jgi:hypothetical protein
MSPTGRKSKYSIRINFFFIYIHGDHCDKKLHWQNTSWSGAGAGGLVGDAEVVGDAVVGPRTTS